MRTTLWSRGSYKHLLLFRFQFKVFFFFFRFFFHRKQKEMKCVCLGMPYTQVAYSWWWLLFPEINNMLSIRKREEKRHKKTPYKCHSFISWRNVFFSFSPSNMSMMGMSISFLHRSDVRIFPIPFPFHFHLCIHRTFVITTTASLINNIKSSLVSSNSNTFFNCCDRNFERAHIRFRSCCPIFVFVIIIITIDNTHKLKHLIHSPYICFVHCTLYTQHTSV